VLFLCYAYQYPKEIIARRKVLYSGALINQKISVIKFTGTPDNIKSINNNFLPECCFIEKEESGLFYLNTSNKLF
jgi:hypothetical protein